MTDSKLNPKLLISEYFDALINRVDIHIEEQLEEYSNQETMEDPEDTNDEPKRVLVWDYLNETREKMIKKISEAQVDALKKLETIRNVNHEKAEEIYEKVFADRFHFIIQINYDITSNYYRPIVKKESLFLFETDFYIDHTQMLLFQMLLK